MFERWARRGVILVSAGAAMLCNAAGPGAAATHEQIVAACREAARPAVVACMQGKRGQGDHDAALEQCRQTVGRPIVVACVTREEQKEAAGKAAPAAPAAAPAPPPSDAFSVQPIFVAPPRTTADINAILEREKPDGEKIAARKAEADAAPPAGIGAAALSQFYYDRAAAKAVLGRNQDALADALQALDAAKRSGEFQRVTRVMQFIGFRYRALGDLKKQTETFESIVTESLAQNKRGIAINALAVLARTASSMGEISQSDAYARRVEALVQEARGSPNPNWRKAYSITASPGRPTQRA
jgi:tetratricopeptide (TPR) repeat protein